MASNVDEKSKAFLARLIRLEQERRDNATDKKEIAAEMKSAALLKEEIAGIKLAVKRHFEEDAARQFRESAEEFAAALGGFADTPLGDAAVRNVKNDPGVRRAQKQGAAALAVVKAKLDKLTADGTTVTIRRSSERGPGSALGDALVAAGVPEV